MSHRLSRPFLWDKLQRAQGHVDRARQLQVRADANFTEAKRLVDEIKAAGQWPELRLAALDGAPVQH